MSPRYPLTGLALLALAVLAMVLVACAANPPAKYEIDRAVVEDIRDELLVAYGRYAGRMDVLCKPSATDENCVAGREMLSKLAAAYTKVKGALKTAQPRLDPELLKDVLPLIAKLAPLAL